MIEAVPSPALSAGRDLLGTGANERTVTTWDASFVMASVRAIGPKRAQRNKLPKKWAQPFPRTGGVFYAEAKTNPPRRSCKRGRFTPRARRGQLSKWSTVGEPAPDPLDGPEAEAREPPGAEWDLHDYDRSGDGHRPRRAGSPPEPEPESV